MRITESAFFTFLSITISGTVIAAGQPDPLPTDGGPTAGQDHPYSYVGTKKCRMCHDKWYRSWLKSPKGNSWEALMPGVGKEIKTRAGLDVHKDYTADARCLVCHAVGFGRPGGYAIPESDDPASLRHAKARRGVGCEACHGPGGGFTNVMRHVMRNKRPYQQEELRAAGLRTITVNVCKSCHNKQALCVSWMYQTPADIDRRLDYHRHTLQGTGAHVSFPLKYRQLAEESSETVSQDKHSDPS